MCTAPDETAWAKLEDHERPGEHREHRAGSRGQRGDPVAAGSPPAEERHDGGRRDHDREGGDAVAGVRLRAEELIGACLDDQDVAERKAEETVGGRQEAPLTKPVREHREGHGARSPHEHEPAAGDEDRPGSGHERERRRPEQAREFRADPKQMAASPP